MKTIEIKESGGPCDGLFILTLWARGGPKTDPQRLCLITKPQVIEYRKLYRSEEPEGDGRASTTFDFRQSTLSAKT